MTDTPADELPEEAAPVGKGSLAGDISGGVASGIIAVTGNVAAGVIAFAPLGADYVGLAILAGMLSSIVAGLLASILGGAPGMISGPKATTATAFAALLGQLIAAGQFDLNSAEQAQVLLTLAFMAVALSGTAQVLLGAFRVGALVKFIPYPVVGGIRNATALLLISSQIWPFMGVPRQSFSEFLANSGSMQPLTVAVAAVTAALAWQGGRFMSKALVPAAALIAGTGLYYAFQLTLTDPRLGPLMGAIPAAIPSPAYAGDFLAVFSSGTFLRYLPILISGALAIAVLDSISALITLVTFQTVANRRFDANRQLIGQGIGTAVGSVFGGLSTSGIFARAAVNNKAGGRTRLSGVFNALTVLLLILALAGPIGMIPKAALAGLILVIAAALFDGWTLSQVRELVRPGGERSAELWLNVAVMLLVVGVGVGVNLIAGVVTGVAVSIVVFLFQMSRSPIRRILFGSTLHSKVRRNPSHSALLSDHGQRIVVLELEGTVFFGSSDAVAQKIETLADEGAEYVIVDLKRVRRIDATGFKVLGQTLSRLAAAGVSLGFSYGGEDDKLERGLIGAAIPEDRRFATTDEALESFENDLLRRLATDEQKVQEWSLRRFEDSLDLDQEDRRIFSARLQQRYYEPGQKLCRIGEPGDSMLLMSRGTADVTIPIPELGRSRRLATVTPGTIVGEMSLLDGHPRSADIVARDHVFCYELTVDHFRTLRTEHPDIAMKIYAALGRTLGVRLREANALISELDA